MFCELEHRLYRLRQSESALDLFDETASEKKKKPQRDEDDPPGEREKRGSVPEIELYRQAAIRCQKEKMAVELALSWV